MRTKIVFDPTQHIPLVANFECGDKPWSQEVADWIKAPATKMESAARQVTRKLVDKVWLFHEDDGRIVGFTSLKKNHWKVDGKPHMPMLYIPYLALSIDFQKKKEPKLLKGYARILFEDLLYEVGLRANQKYYKLGLHVHEGNDAIGFYESYGFKISGYEKPYHRMIVDAQIAKEKGQQFDPESTPASPAPVPERSQPSPSTKPGG